MSRHRLARPRWQRWAWTVLGTLLLAVAAWALTLAAIVTAPPASLPPVTPGYGCPSTPAPPQLTPRDGRVWWTCAHPPPL